MRNLLSISLITIYLFGNTEFGQIFNLPELAKHYNFHHAANHSVTFAQFLMTHYFGDDGTTADDNEDSKLPFKQIHAFCFTFFETPSILALQGNTNFTIHKQQKFFFASPYLKNVYLNTILQPPRSIA